MSSASLQRTLGAMLDPRLGIVRRIAPVPLQPGEPPLFIFAAHCTRPKYFLHNDSSPPGEADYAVPANGVDVAREPALWRALGEAAERYAGGIYDVGSFVTATRQELGDAALPLESLIGFSPEQYARRGFPFARYDPHAPLRWVRGRNLTRGTACWVPAALVYLGCETLSRAECIQPSMSSGMAAGRSLPQALLSGVCELVERDAVMCAWLLRHVPRQLRIASLLERLDTAGRGVLAGGSAAVTLLDLTTDIGLPAVLSVLQPKGRRSFVVGAAARTDMLSAAVRATVEAWHTFNWSLFLERRPLELRPEDVRELEHHVRFWLDERHFDAAAWLFESERAEIAPADPVAVSPAARLRAAVARLRAIGLDVYFVETTTDDVRELGFRTVRVIVPGLQPLHAGYGMAHEDRRRLRRVVEFRGLPEPEHLNPDPHPFP